jgi:phage terminase large subunit-like protein
LDGTIQDDSFFPFIAAAGPEDDWKSEEVWARVNPSYGVTIAPSEMAEACAAAQQSPAEENSFRRYRLNQWTEQETRWLSLDVWDRNGGSLSSLDGRSCYAGLDLASTTDLSAFVLAFPVDDRVDVLPFFWAPKEKADERERKNQAQYREWARAGHITLTPGNVVDYDVIRRTINELGKRYRIREIAIDRWNATQLSTQLMGDGFKVTGFGQGYASMSGPTKELEALLLSGRIRHAGHPVLRWNAGNVAVEMDAAGNLKPTKEKSPEKIDGIVALIMAIALLSAQVRHNSVYDGRGVLVV